MRLIDADALKTVFPCGEQVRTKSVRAIIDHTPTVSQWIPCCERLPRIEENPVLVSWMGLVNIGWYNPINGWTTGTRFNVDEVDAWMPLPAPYKEGEK